MFRGRHGHLLNASCAFNLYPVTMENCHHFYYKTSSTKVENVLVLSGNLDLNPGFFKKHQIQKEDFEVFNNKGLHFMYVTINSLLNKIDELRYIASCCSALVIEIIETKLDNTVCDSKDTVDGYNIVGNDRNKNGVGVGCYIRNNI